MVVMGHGLGVSFWVSEEMTKIKVGPKKEQCVLELISLSILSTEDSVRKKSPGKFFFCF